jgi:hypothetical protein
MAIEVRTRQRAHVKMATQEHGTHLGDGSRHPDRGGAGRDAAAETPTHYLVGTPRGRLSQMEKDFLAKPRAQVRDAVRVKLVEQAWPPDSVASRLAAWGLPDTPRRSRHDPMITWSLNGLCSRLALSLTLVRRALLTAAGLMAPGPPTR